MSLSIVKRNVVANFLSNAWTGLVTVALTPFYIKLLGIEAWGMVGIFISLQSLCMLLDFGLSAMVNRELARLSLHQDNAKEMRDLVRTTELIYWGIAFFLGISIFGLAPAIANHWVQAKHLSPSTIYNAVRLMGLAVCLECPFRLYAGGLSGLQRQVLLSRVNIGIATLRGLGTIFILWRVSPTLWAFFLCQIGAGVLQTGLAGLYLWRTLLPTGSRSTFQKAALRNSWRFSAGMSGIMVMSLILTQMDKVILSGLLSLEMFGYYVLANTIATGIYVLVMPIYTALYPRFTQLVTLADQGATKKLYHQSSQWLAAAVLPVCIIIALFSREILLLWTGEVTTAQNTCLVLSILIVGTGLNGLMYLPYALQFAYGWVKLAFWINLVSVVVLMPLLVVMAKFYGAIGAASTWLIFNCGLTLATIELMHRRLLKGEQWKWYVEDVGIPLIVSLSGALLCRAIAPRDANGLHLFSILASTTVFVMGCTFAATSVTRVAIIDYFKTWRAR